MAKKITPKRKKSLKNIKARIRYAERQGFVFGEEFKKKISEMTPAQLEKLRGKTLWKRAEYYETLTHERVQTKQAIKTREVRPKDTITQYQLEINRIYDLINNQVNVDQRQQAYFAREFALAINRHGEEQVYKNLILYQEAHGDIAEFIEQSLKYDYTNKNAGYRRSKWVDILNQKAFTIDELQKNEDDFEEWYDKSLNPVYRDYNSYSGDGVG